jgi:hypothetical protein
VEALLEREGTTLPEVLGRFIRVRLGSPGCDWLLLSRRENFDLFLEWLEGPGPLPVPPPGREAFAFYQAVFARRAGLLTKREQAEEVQAIQERLEQLRAQWKALQQELKAPNLREEERRELQRQCQEILEEGKGLKAHLQAVERGQGTGRFPVPPSEVKVRKGKGRKKDERREAPPSPQLPLPFLFNPEGSPEE